MMTIREVVKIVSGEVLVGEDRLDERVDTACGSDLMSDVLAFVKEKTVLITGLINPHVVRTSEMLDITCIVFSRGKKPSEENCALDSWRGFKRAVHVYDIRL